MENFEENRLSGFYYKCSTPAAAFHHYRENADKSEFKTWIDNIIKEMPQKMDTQAEKFRNEGNVYYRNRQFTEALRLYNKSLRYATFNNEDYGKALGNRSAVHFECGNYSECLKDIALCWKSKYPQKSKNTILLRKLQCYHKLNMTEEFQMLYTELHHLVENNPNFKILGKEKQTLIKDDTTVKERKDIDSLQMNERFAYAANNIRLNYSDNLGRHVTAVSNIPAGTILFKEKAFMSTLVFENSEDLVDDMCYNCLKQTAHNNIPCESCTYCIYCSEECKQNSWTLCHRFECAGMNLWHKLGLGLPAFKFLMKGITSEFKEAATKSAEFGSYIDNYPYANSLLYKFAHRTDQHQLPRAALMITLYLKDRTDFFEFLADRFIGRDCNDLEQLVGTQLIKHMAQILTNGSLVYDTNKMSIGAAIYPSISMMNHSCEPNICIEYDGDVAIVTAARNIQKGEQICNNYGVDPSISKHLRRAYLKKTFYFNCICDRCKLNN